MQEIERLLRGYQDFYRQFFVDDGVKSQTYRKLATEGQSPKTTIISCGDSRVDPAIITGTDPGDFFGIRNVANIVPPYQPDENAHGVSACLEFSVNILKVRHIIVLGHSKCGGIKALLEKKSDQPSGPSFIRSWMAILDDVRQDVMHNHPELSDDDKARVCERNGVEKSLRNLMTFPWITEKVKDKELYLHGWYINIEDGILWSFNQDKKAWQIATEVNKKIG